MLAQVTTPNVAILAVEFSTEGIAVIGVLMAALSGAVALLFRSLMTSMSQQVKAAEAERDSYKADRDSYKSMAIEAIENLEGAINRALEAKGKPRIRPLAAVIPEHSSPVTPGQEVTADISTMRARLVAATLIQGLPARAVDANGDEVVISLPADVSGDTVDKVEAAAEKTEAAAEETKVAAKKTQAAAEEIKAVAAKLEAKDTKEQ